MNPGEYGFGGDFGPSSGKQDSHFVLDGILFPDRSPHPAYYESQLRFAGGFTCRISLLLGYGDSRDLIHDVPSPEIMA